jgi:hypothetical protein
VACLVRTRRADTKPVQISQTASLAELTSRIEQFGAIQTLRADVQLQLSFLEQDEESIKEFSNVSGFILIQQPGSIRVRALVPVVRSTAIDMASSGATFQVHIPSKNRFLVGDTVLSAPSPKRVENVRPQHILEALLIAPLEEHQEKPVLENVIEGNEAFQVVDLIAPAKQDETLRLTRKIWFDRTNLSITRQQVFDNTGNVVTNAWYREWADEDGVPFPHYVFISRPLDGYDLQVRILKVTLNGSVPENAFELMPPPGTKIERIEAAAEAATGGVVNP